MSNNFYETWSGLVERIARFTSYDFPDIEPQDLEQDLYEEVLKRKWENADEFGAVAILRKVAKDKAMQYRSQHLILSPQYNYRTSDVKKILEKVFAYEDWKPKRSFTEVEEDGVTVPVEQVMEPHYDLDEILISHSDVKRAWESLPYNYRKIIFLRFALGDHPETDAGQRQLHRAVERLTDILNRYRGTTSHNGIGSRRAISNARARYILDTQD